MSSRTMVVTMVVVTLKLRLVDYSPTVSRIGMERQSLSDYGSLGAVHPPFHRISFWTSLLETGKRLHVREFITCAAILHPRPW